MSEVILARDQRLGSIGVVFQQAVAIYFFQVTS